jgi:hypothetical protein
LTVRHTGNAACTTSAIATVTIAANDDRINAGAESKQGPNREERRENVLTYVFHDKLVLSASEVRGRAIHHIQLSGRAFSNP